MTASEVEYQRDREWVRGMLDSMHATVVQTMTWATLYLLVAQRITPAALAWALPTEQAGSTRVRAM